MSNRFEKLYSLPSPLYAPSMPVIIVAGALLKDTQTDKVLAQLKFKSVSPKAIKAVTVSLLPLDTANQPLGEKETHQILDLAANRDAEFGQKSPLYFFNNTTRAYRVIVEEVIFSDNTVWKSTGTPLADLPAQKKATDILSNNELQKQYKLEYGERAAYIADTYSDLWRCNCGAINRSDEQSCHGCGATKADILSFDTEQLKSSCHNRLEEEHKKAEQHLAESGRRKKQAKKIGIIGGILAVIAFIVVTIVIPKIKIQKDFSRAISLLDDGYYSSAEHILDRLDDVDSLNAKKYEHAVLFYEEGKYIPAVTLLERTHNYSDSGDYLIKSTNLLAENYYQQGDYLSCIRLCESKQTYPDAYHAACYCHAVELKDKEYYTGAIEFFEKAGNYLDSVELKHTCEIGEKYKQAISYMRNGGLSSAIAIFEEIGSYESSSEYLALCKTYAKYKSYWVAKSSKYYDKTTGETSSYTASGSLNIVVKPEENGDVIFMVNEKLATLSGNVLSYSDNYWGDCTFNLSTGIGRVNWGNQIIDTTYEKLEK